MLWKFTPRETYNWNPIKEELKKYIWMEIDWKYCYTHWEDERYPLEKIYEPYPLWSIPDIIWIAELDITFN